MQILLRVTNFLLDCGTNGCRRFSTEIQSLLSSTVCLFIARSHWMPTQKTSPLPNSRPRKNSSLLATAMAVSLTFGSVAVPQIAGNTASVAFAAGVRGLAFPTWDDEDGVRMTTARQRHHSTGPNWQSSHSPHGRCRRQGRQVPSGRLHHLRERREARNRPREAWN